MTLKPIQIKSQLAPNPKRSPTYAKKVKLSSGDEIEVADPMATRAMVALMDMQAGLNGAASHFGGPSAFAELMSALHGLAFDEAKKANKQWFELFHLINDAGHCENGIYALKANYGFADLTLESLKGFRSIHSPLTGHGESHLFPTGVYLSNGPLGSSLPQAQGLCFADRLANINRTTVVSISDGACMEGEAREAFAAIPGFAAKGKMNPFVMIISDNNTGLTGRIDEQSFSMVPSFKALKELGWNVIELKQAHDLQNVTEVLQKAFSEAHANPNKPVAIHAKTIKGYGVKKTEESASGGHGFPVNDPNQLKAFLEEIYQGHTLPAEFSAWCEELIDLHATMAKEKTNKPPSQSLGFGASEKVQVGVTAALNKKRQQGYPIISISSDLPGSTGTAGFHKSHSDSFLDVGVAESNMVSMAAGLSKQGFIPIVDTFSQFGVTKGALPLIMSSLSQAPMIAVFSHAGFQDAADGASHQALSYIAMTAAIPHVDVYCLTTSREAEALVSQALDEFYQDRKQGRVPHSKVFFLGRENFPQSYLPEDYNYKLGQSQIVFNNSDHFKKVVTIAAAGPLVGQALLAAQSLAEQNVGAVVVNVSVVNKPDLRTLSEALKLSKGALVTAEDHQVNSGMAAILCRSLLEYFSEKAHQVDFPIRLKSLGVQGEFGQSAYSAEELYKKHGMDSSSIAKAALELA